MITELENNSKRFYILLQRTSWLFPLHLDSRNPLYIDAMYNQCLPEYLDGNMISVPNKSLPQPLKVWYIWLKLWVEIQRCMLLLSINIMCSCVFTRMRYHWLEHYWCVLWRRKEHQASMFVKITTIGSPSFRPPYKIALFYHSFPKWLKLIYYTSNFNQSHPWHILCIT